MKTTLLFLSVFLSASLFGQKLINDTFTSSDIKDADMIKTKLTFQVRDLNVIDSSEIFKMWVENTFNDPENKEWIKDNAQYSKVELFLDSRVRMTAMEARFELSDPRSNYYYVKESEGLMYLSDIGTFNTSMVIQEKNSYGTLVTKKVYGTCSIKGDELNDTIFFD